ncbi:hypothetical protein IKE19_01455 [Candidatus Saccharibacteria bacterium]|nr:hypothetical protein [Candidatus Saccharibacteria bacterium]
MNSLFSESMIGKIRKVKKSFLWAAVCILIGEVVVGAILILAQSFNETIGRLMGTFAACAIMLFLGVNNFSRMEKNDRIVQSFALVGFICNLIWLFLAFLFIWNIVPFIESSGVWSYSYRMTAMAKLFSVAVDIAVMSFCVSNTWAIEETLKPVRPLKITALICAFYCGIYSVIVTIGDVQAVTDGRWYGLAALAGFAFVVMVIAAVIVSKNGKKKKDKEVDGVNKEGMQATIQELVEKEVQERLKEERARESERLENYDQVVGDVQSASGVQGVSAGETQIVGHEPKSVPDSIYPDAKEK